ncbi:FeoA family protein [Micrococcus sp.]|uniref:FeoA family protein n=1 Tax=Micrococcus sp. TaxID=1271 RepID=UPI002A90FD4E|nr:FeoA family protein [Micrococcus sp.]MDY6054932.1 FeoA family protein [Micrococcus sp.]
MTLTLSITQDLRLRDVTGGAGTPPAALRTLADLADGETATVTGVCDAVRPEVARRLFDLGFMPGMEVTRVRRAPFGGPLVVRVADYELTLRRDQARCVILSGPTNPGAAPSACTCPNA